MASNIEFENDGNDSNVGLGTVALKTTINGIDVSLPTISPQKTELFRANKRNMVINSELVTYIEHVTSIDDFVANSEVYQSNYEEFTKLYPDKIANFSLDLHPNEKLDEDAVKVIREIQLNSDSPFLFEYEIDSEQDVATLKKQLENTQKWIAKNKSPKILVPVIDIKIQKEGLFLEKLESLSPTYKRINIIYRTPNRFQNNWSLLKAFLKENEIWCHMDCVLNRYNNERIAHRVRFYSIGILSTSVGYPFGGNSSSKKKRILQFNPANHKYEVVEPPYEPSFAEKQDRTWIESLIEEIAELQNMREHVVEKTLYTVYLPTKGVNYLAFTEGI